MYHVAVVQSAWSGGPDSRPETQMMLWFLNYVVLLKVMLSIKHIADGGKKKV